MWSAEHERTPTYGVHSGSELLRASIGIVHLDVGHSPYEVEVRLAPVDGPGFGYPLLESICAPWLGRSLLGQTPADSIGRRDGCDRVDPRSGTAMEEGGCSPSKRVWSPMSRSVHRTQSFSAIPWLAQRRVKMLVLVGGSVRGWLGKRRMPKRDRRRSSRSPIGKRGLLRTADSAGQYPAARSRRTGSR